MRELFLICKNYAIFVYSVKPINIRHTEKEYASSLENFEYGLRR